MTNTWGVTALPLWESRLEIRCQRLLREEKHVIHFPISVIELGYLASTISETNLVKTTFWYLLFIVNFCLNNFLHWFPSSIVTFGGIQDSTTLRSRDTESTTEHKLTTLNIYFPSEYSMDHVNFALDRKLLKATHYNGFMFIHKVWKAVIYQSSLSTSFDKGWDHRWGKHPLRLWETE